MTPVRSFTTTPEDEPQEARRRLDYGIKMRALIVSGIGSAVSLEAEPMPESFVADPDIAVEFARRLEDSSPLAFRIALGVLRNREDAEDVAQEAFLRAYRSFHRLRDRERFRAWLARITWRLALDRLRARGRRERREWAAADSRPAPTIEDLAASREFQRHLEQAMDELPEKLRQALILAAVEGHDMQEVGRLLGVPAGTVKSRLYLARKKLAEKLQWLAGHTKKS